MKGQERFCTRLTDKHSFTSMRVYSKQCFLWSPDKNIRHFFTEQQPRAMWHESFGTRERLCLTLQQAEQFDWYRHLDRLCTVTSDEKYGRCRGLIVYHTADGDGGGAHQRIIEVDAATNNFHKLSFLYDVIQEAFNKNDLATLRLNYDQGQHLIIPFAHFVGVEITRQNFMVCSCKVNHYEKLRPGSEPTAGNYALASRILKAFSLWKEVREYMEKTGPKRRIDDELLEETQKRSKSAKPKTDDIN